MKLADKSYINNSGCLIWTGSTNNRGYGQITINNKCYPVHRIAYEQAGGELVEGMEIDHLCRERLCIKPEHLEQITHKENLIRGNTLAGENARKTHCVRGHTLSEYTGTVRRRLCRECKNIRQRLYRARKKRMTQ